MDLGAALGATREQYSDVKAAEAAAEEGAAVELRVALPGGVGGEGGEGGGGGGAVVTLPCKLGHTVAYVKLQLEKATGEELGVGVRSQCCVMAPLLRGWRRMRERSASGASTFERTPLALPPLAPSSHSPSCKQTSHQKACPPTACSWRSARAPAPAPAASCSTSCVWPTSRRRSAPAAPTT